MAGGGERGGSGAGMSARGSDAGVSARGSGAGVGRGRRANTQVR